MSNKDELIEISVVVDSEGAEAVSELFNQYNGGGYDEDNEAGEAGGGGAVIEITGFDDFGQSIEGEEQITVKTFVKPGKRGQEIRRKIEEGLWRLSLIRPMAEPQIRTMREEDWAHAWKKNFKPLRVGQRVVLKPSWESYSAQPDRLCIRALENIIQPGDPLLDIGTGSGVLSIVGRRLGADLIIATDIDPLAVQVTDENAARNHISVGEEAKFIIRQDSVPAGYGGHFPVVVANILAEILARLFDCEYGNVPLAEPLAPGGKMILAGILAEKAYIVIEAAERHGLTFVEQLQEEDWVAIIVKRG